MIVICFGMPRSASTTLWLIVSRLAEAQCRLVNEPFTQYFWRPGKLPENGEGIRVLKLHGHPKERHLELMKSGKGIAIGSRRDIPGVITSMKRLQPIDRRFAGTKDRELEVAEREYAAYLEWVRIGGLGFSFEEITQDRQKVADKICSSFGWSQPYGCPTESGEYEVTPARADG